MRPLRRLLLVALPLVLLACKESTSPPPKVAGRWYGYVGAFSLEMTLLQDDRVLFGTATMSGSGGTVRLDVDGTFDYPDAELTLSAAGVQPLYISAELEDNNLFGVANGSGIVNAAVSLNR